MVCREGAIGRKGKTVEGARAAARSLPYAEGVRVREDGTSEAAGDAQAQ